MATDKQKAGKEALNTIVGKNSVLEGYVKIEDGIRVDGTLKGQLHASGTLVVGPSGKVEADPIHVQDAVIAGQLTGKLEAVRRVKLEASAVLTGDITAQTIIVEEGAVFRGLCNTGADADPALSVEPQQPALEAKKAVG